MRAAVAGAWSTRDCWLLKGLAAIALQSLELADMQSRPDDLGVIRLFLATPRLAALQHALERVLHPLTTPHILINPSDDPPLAPAPTRAATAAARTPAPMGGPQAAAPAAATAARPFAPQRAVPTAATTARPPATVGAHCVRAATAGPSGPGAATHATAAPSRNAAPPPGHTPTTEHMGSQARPAGRQRHRQATEKAAAASAGGVRGLNMSARPS